MDGDIDIDTDGDIDIDTDVDVMIFSELVPLLLRRLRLPNPERMASQSHPTRRSQRDRDPTILGPLKSDPISKPLKGI